MRRTPPKPTKRSGTARPPLKSTAAAKSAPVVDWSPPAPVDLREYLGSQLQYWFGLRPERVRALTEEMATIVENGDAADKDKINAMQVLAQWKKLEMDAGLKVGDWLQQAGAAQPAASEVSDEQLLQGLRLLALEHEPAPAAVADTPVVIDNEEILPLEGVG